MVGRGGIYGDLHGDGTPVRGSRVAPEVHVSKSECAHDWNEWREIGRTGDWFHPLIMRRDCKNCTAWETEDR